MYGKPGNLRCVPWCSLTQASKPGFELPAARLHLGPCEPLVNGLAFELQEDAFPSVLDGRKPGRLASQGSTPNTDFQFALDVGGRGLEACEANLGDDFAEPMDQNDALDRVHPRGLGVRHFSAGSVRAKNVPSGSIVAEFRFGGNQRFEFGLLDGLRRLAVARRCATESRRGPPRP